MLGIVSVNRSLGIVQSNIASAQLKIDMKKEELRKLENALIELGNKKSDFISEKHICLEPEFTSKTLNGDNAEKLDDIREGQLEVSFLAIPEDQIGEAEEIIASKVKEVKEEISSLENVISSNQSNRQSLLTQKRKEMSKT